MVLPSLRRQANQPSLAQPQPLRGPEVTDLLVPRISSQTPVIASQLGLAWAGNRGLASEAFACHYFATG